MHDSTVDISEVSHRSKVALSSAYLFANIIRSSLLCESNKCEFMNEEQHKSLIESVLSNTLILGGACRGLLLKKAINDIDIICNTRELNKIHLFHLKQYHLSIDCQSRTQSCFLWNYYLQKFDTESQEYDIKMLKDINDDNEKDMAMKSSEYIRNCSYVLNAKCLVSLMTNSEKLRNKLNIYNIFETSEMMAFMMNITDDIIFNGFNLSGQEFDIWDVGKRDFSNFVEFERSKMRQKRVELKEDEDEIDDIDDIDKKKKHFVRLESLRINSKREIFQERMDNNDLIEIFVPIQTQNISQHFEGNDLSINCGVLSLFAVQNTMNEYIENIDDISFSISHEMCLKLGTQIKSGTPLYDVQKDLKRKILTSSEKTVFSQTPQIHFWRIIKFAIRYYDDGWIIDKKLIRLHEDLYHEWIGNEEKEFVPSNDGDNVIYQIWKYKKMADSADEYKKMCKIFITMKFDKQLQNALNRNHILKQQWLQQLNKQNDGIIEVFKYYNYPIQ